MCGLFLYPRHQGTMDFGELFGGLQLGGMEVAGLGN
jgi:hypothetical protein